MERSHLFTLGDIGKSTFTKFENPLLLNYWNNFIRYIIITSLNIFEVVYLVCDVTHGPLVLYCFSLCKRVKKSLWLTRRHIYNIKIPYFSSTEPMAQQGTKFKCVQMKGPALFFSRGENYEKSKIY